MLSSGTVVLEGGQVQEREKGEKNWLEAWKEDADAEREKGVKATRRPIVP